MTFEQRYENTSDNSEVESDIEHLCRQIGEHRFFEGAMFILSTLFYVEDEDENEYRAYLKSIYDTLGLSSL